MTTVYALSILLAFALPGSAWLGWLLWEARDDLRITRLELAHQQRIGIDRVLTAVAWQQRWTRQGKTLQETADRLAAHEVALCIVKGERDTIAKREADTFPMPTVHGHDAEITSPAVAEQPSPLYDETVRYFASRRLGAVR